MEIQEIIQQLDFSNLGWQIATPIIFSIADIITGFIQAVINNDVRSRKMREGLLHKILIIIILLLSFVASATFNLSMISKFVCVYIIIMETISIFENLAKAGIDFKELKKIFFIGGKNEERRKEENREERKESGEDNDTEDDIENIFKDI